MYFSPSVSKRFVLVPILVVVAIQLLFIRIVSCLNMTNAYLHHQCYVTQGKYKTGSEYEKSLNEIIRSLSMGNFSTGFEWMSFGNPVSVLHQCRGDSYGPKCRTCYATALSGLQRRCPRNKGGIIWYDQCFLEISGINSFSKLDYDNYICMSNAKNVSDNNQSFNRKWIRHLDGLATKAANSESNRGYAAGGENLGTKKLYGMVQCTRDIGPKDCEKCYAYNRMHFQDCMYGKQGARVLGRSCNFRFELYPFVDTKTGFHEKKRLL